jgi:hypothetical protein
MFGFLALVVVRGVAGICAGERIANRLAVLLQLVTIVLLLEVFLFLPVVLFKLMSALTRGASAYGMFPPLWFWALYGWIAEGQGLLAYAAAGVTATIGVVVLAVAISLAPAAWMGRRALHVRSREPASVVMPLARAIAWLCTREPAVRAMFLFAAASLTRSRRHTVILASYLGMAIGAAGLGVIAALLRGTFDVAEPRPFLLAVPLVFIFFAVFGLRGAISIPTDIDANWPFRMATPRIDASVQASRLLMFSFGVIPIAALWLLLSLGMWPAGFALRTAALNICAGLVVLEMSLLGWSKIPFATAHEPSTETLRSRWMWYLLFLGIFAKGGASIQFAAAGSTRNTITYVVVAAAAVGVIRLLRIRQGRRLSPSFDATSSGIEALNLSEAAN